MNVDSVNPQFYITEEDLKKSLQLKVRGDLSLECPCRNHYLKNCCHFLKIAPYNLPVY
jgi:hypothetical protein